MLTWKNCFVFVLFSDLAKNFSAIFFIIIVSYFLFSLFYLLIASLHILSSLCCPIVKLGEAHEFFYSFAAKFGLHAPLFPKRQGGASWKPFLLAT